MRVHLVKIRIKHELNLYDRSFSRVKRVDELYYLDVKNIHYL